MSFSRYPSYREVDGGGEVPSHWPTPHMKRVARLTYGDALALDVRDTDGEVAVYGSNGAVGVHSCANTLAPVILVGRKGSCGALNWAENPSFAIDTVYFIDSQSTSEHLRWLFWALHALGLSDLSQDTGVPGLPREVAHELRLPTPPETEQVAISAFLDRETGKIDALVEAQRRLIELLKEKRQAVISHAVTKGIDAAAPMMDSAVRWMGEIPAHWSISQSRRLFAVRSEPALPDDQMLTASQKYGVLFQSDFVELEGRRVVEVIMGKDNLRHVEPDDFVISMRSFQGGLEWSRLKGSTSFHYVMVTPIKWVHPPFFAHLFKCLPYIHALRATTDLIRDGQEIRYSHFVKVPLPVIPLEEQREITDFLNVEVSRYDKLLDQAAQFILLLQERRAALITAAVTGKIDLRQAAATVSAADQATARRLVGAAVLELVADNATSGRMTSAKRMYLAEAHAGVWELRGQPQRKAAGPFDSALMGEVETELARVGHIATSQPGAAGSQVYYRLTGARGALRAELDAMLGDRRAVFDRMLVDLSTLESKGIEAVATLFAVWNDMLIDGQTPTDNAVVDGVLNDWHEEKRDKFTRLDLNNYLGWMRRHDMTPSGRGPRTKMGALL